MTTVYELIEFLQTLPPDAIVECGEESTTCYSSETVMVPVDIYSTKVLDFSSKEDQEKYPQMLGKIYIELHGEQILVYNLLTLTL